MYAIEVLPVHPQPQPLETLTSYVMRLAEANGLQKVAGFAQLLKVKYTVPRWNDLPVKDWGYLPELAQCPVDRLNQTTLYHLGYKFHRKLGPSFSKFVVGTLSPHRRYCSQCLAETGYDRLPWRFLQLRGCPEHQCLLLESCPHCKENLPLLVSPLYQFRSNMSHKTANRSPFNSSPSQRIGITPMGLSILC
jgi:hypothetical protein